MSTFELLKPFLADIDDEHIKVVSDLLDKIGTDKLNLANLATGDYVKKAKYDGDVGRLTTENTSLTTQITDLQTSLKEASTATGDIDALKTKAASDLAESQTKFDEAQATADKSALAYEIQLGVVTAGAKEATSVMAHLDMEKISMITVKLDGLDAQLAPMKTETHKYLFGEAKRVFSTETPNPPGPTDDAASEWSNKYTAAKKVGDLEAETVRLEAFAEGVVINE